MKRRRKKKHLIDTAVTINIYKYRRFHLQLCIIFSKIILAFIDKVYSKKKKRKIKFKKVKKKERYLIITFLVHHHDTI